MSLNVRYRRSASISFGNFDKLLTFAAVGLLLIGTMLVYAGTREWFRSYGLDPEYYFKRHTLNIIIGGLLAYGTTLIDYRLLRAYTPIVWLVAHQIDASYCHRVRPLIMRHKVEHIVDELTTLAVLDMSSSQLLDQAQPTIRVNPATCRASYRLEQSLHEGANELRPT